MARSRAADRARAVTDRDQGPPARTIPPVGDRHRRRGQPDRPRPGPAGARRRLAVLRNGARLGRRSGGRGARRPAAAGHPGDPDSRARHDAGARLGGHRLRRRRALAASGPGGARRRRPGPARRGRRLGGDAAPAVRAPAARDRGAGRRPDLGPRPAPGLCAARRDLGLGVVPAARACERGRPSFAGRAETDPGRVPAVQRGRPAPPARAAQGQPGGATRGLDRARRTGPGRAARTAARSRPGGAGADRRARRNRSAPSL